MEIDEQVRLKQLKLTDDTAKVADQDKSLADLRAQIDAEQAKLEETNQGLDAARKLHRREEENQRELSLKNAALNEKLAFIQAHYDYKSQVKKMDLDKFSKLTSSNMQINKTVEDFVKRMGTVKQEISDLDIKAKAWD